MKVPRVKLGKQMSTELKLRMHNIISKAKLHYRIKPWLIYRKGQKEIEGGAKLPFLRVLLALTIRDKQINIETRKGLNRENIVDEIRNYQQNWLLHINGMGEKKTAYQS